MIIWHFLSEPPLSLRFSASAVTLSGLAGGEYLPLPRSKGGAFPFLLASLPASHGGRSGLTLDPPQADCSQQMSPCLPQAGQPAAGRSETKGVP